MRIFSPGYLRDIDNFLGQVRQGPNKKKGNGQHLQATMSKIRSKFFKWIVKPIVLVGTCTYALHLYNQHVESTWINSTINVYELKQKVLWEARWLLLKGLLKGEFDTAKPMVYYAIRMNCIADHLENGAETVPKILHKEVVAAIDTWIFKWNVVTHQRLVNKRGDLVDEVTYTKFQLFGLNIWNNVESKILKPYKKIESKRRALWGLIQTQQEELNLMGDVLSLKLPKFLGQPQPSAVQFALNMTKTASESLNKILADAMHQQSNKI